MSIRRWTSVMVAVAIFVTACGGDDTADTDDAAVDASDTSVIEDVTTEETPATDVAVEDTTGGAEETTGGVGDDIDLDALEDFDLSALAGLDLDCLEMSFAALPFALAPLALFSDEEDFDVDELLTELDDLIGELPEDFHAELEAAARLMEEAKGMSLTDPDHPFAGDEYTEIWDSFDEKFKAACPDFNGGADFN